MNKKLLTFGLFALCFLMISLNTLSASASINIISPVNMANLNSITNLALNYNVIGASIGYDYNCWYSPDNGISNSTQGQCFNISILGLTATEGINKWTVWVNESNSTLSISHVASTQVQFSIDSIPPAITIYAPQNIYYGNITNSLNNITFNISEINPCTYWIYNGIVNITATPATCTNINTTIYYMNMTIGTNTWTIYARDSFNNIGSSSIAFTYDPNNPLLQTGPTYTMYINDADINFRFNKDVQANMWYWTNDTFRNYTHNLTNWNNNIEFSLNDLTNNTIYFFNITAMDHAINRVYYGPYNFTFNSTAPQIIYSCYTNAICGAWGACSAMGLQSRTCNKINASCGYSTLPIITQTCNYSTQTVQPPITTVPLNNLTNTTKTKEPWGGLSDNAKYALIGLAVVIIIGVGIAIFMRYRNPEYNDIPRTSEEQPYIPANDADIYLGDNA